MADGSPIVAPEIARYLQSLRPAPDPLLARLEEEARADQIPIVPPDTAHLLGLLCRLARPERVLEVGTAIGYSAIHLARALPAWAHLDTIEVDLDTAARAERNLQEAGLLGERVTVMRGPALELLPLLSHRYDLLFLDAKKQEYEGYLALALKLMPRGAMVLVDNLLWGGRAATGDRPTDEPWRREATRAIQRFNERFLRHPELSASILPVGDGLGIGLKV